MDIKQVLSSHKFELQVISKNECVIEPFKKSNFFSLDRILIYGSVLALTIIAYYSGNYRMLSVGSFLIIYEIYKSTKAKSFLGGNKIHIHDGILNINKGKETLSISGKDILDIQLEIMGYNDQNRYGKVKLLNRGGSSIELMNIYEDEEEFIRKDFEIIKDYLKEILDRD